MTHATQESLSFESHPHEEKALREAQAAGEKIEDQQIVNYFGTPEPIRFYLPDGKQFFEFTPLTEAGKAKYERATNKDIRVQRSSGDAKMTVDQAAERHALIMLSVTDAEIYGPTKPLNKIGKMPFTQSKSAEIENDFWSAIFKAFPPKIIQDLYRKIRDANEWMNSEEDLEALKAQHKELGERIVKLEDEAEKD